MTRSGFPPIGSEAQGLEDYPSRPDGLARRMAEVWGARPEQVLPVRGATHGLELVFRRISLDGFTQVAAEPDPGLERLASIYRLDIVAEPGPKTGAVVVRSPSDPLGLVAPPDEASRLPARVAPALLVVDESGADLMEAPSLASEVGEHVNLVVLRSLSGVYGLAGARCGALIAAEIGRFEAVLEPHALPTSTVRVAEAALSPSRAVLIENRIALLRAERTRLANALAKAPAVKAVTAGEGPFVFLEVRDPANIRRVFDRLGVRAEWREDVTPGGVRLDLGVPEVNDRALAALGVSSASKPSRRAELVRDTRETQIAVALDLDDPSKGRVATGVGFYDHMLDQVASHGGFRLDLECRGDLEIDAHHTIEDCALTFGAALKQALGERRGIARFGFVLPMDEAEAKVTIDLGGRPYSVFAGAFSASHIGDYPTEMTAHVFRSLAESLGAAVHVSVEGGNDHHKTEACFKAFGRALRQALRIEGGEIPSTKGVI